MPSLASALSKNVGSTHSRIYIIYRRDLHRKYCQLFYWFLYIYIYPFWNYHFLSFMMCHFLLFIIHLGSRIPNTVIRCVLFWENSSAQPMRREKHHLHQPTTSPCRAWSYRRSVVSGEAASRTVGLVLQELRDVGGSKSSLGYGHPIRNPDAGYIKSLLMGWWPIPLICTIQLLTMAHMESGHHVDQELESRDANASPPWKARRTPRTSPSSPSSPISP